MISGFHYTSIENWHHIQNEGLIPQPVTKPELIKHLGEFSAIWIWTRELRGDEHIGSILWQVMTKASTRIVKLAVQLSDDDVLLSSDDRTIEILHDGLLGTWKYHHGAPAVLVTSKIPSERITLVEHYDLNSWCSSTQTVSS